MPRFVRVRDAPNNPGGRWVEDKEVVIPIIQQGIQGIPGLTSVLIDDPDPTLSADLKLNGHGLVGEIEKDTLVIDGGLL